MGKKKPNKRHILARLVDLPKAGRRAFYVKEMAILNRLCERYSLEFMDVMTFPRKVDSLAYFESPKLRHVMDSKFRIFNFEVDETLFHQYNIHNKRFGADVHVKKPHKKTIKNFLDE